MIKAYRQVDASLPMITAPESPRTGITEDTYESDQPSKAIAKKVSVLTHAQNV